MNSADLHLHTQASDGTDSINKRLEQAEEQGLDGIAITDHDTINSELEQRSKITENGVELITGAEIKCEVKNNRIEILGYFLDPEGEEIHQILDRLREFRVARMEEMIYQVNDHLDSEISYEDVEQYAEGPVGRPHLAQAMKEKGLVDKPGEAFNKYIGSDDPCYVRTEKLDASHVISEVHANGGVASLAHPGRDLPEEEADELVAELAEKGLDAIEVPYTYNHKRQDGYTVNFGIKKAAELAEEHDLLISGGSDCHGSKSDKYNIGKVKLDYRHVEKLRSRAEEYQNTW